MKELLTIAENLRSQDDRGTDQPMFLVQKKVRDYGIADGYADDYVWVDEDGDAVDELRAQRLDILDNMGIRYRRGKREPYKCVGYRDRWETVTACFTEQGCRDFMAADGHNHGELRIYADGSYRNFEFRKIRNYLLSLNEVAA